MDSTPRDVPNDPGQRRPRQAPHLPLRRHPIAGRQRRVPHETSTGSPLVSILLPLRNAAPTLRAALCSVQRQQFSDWECVIVDDGSTDKSPWLARQWAAADPRFRLFERPACGLVEALNFGLAQCRAPFVARMDADDLMHSARLARQVATLREDLSLALLGCRVRLFPRHRLRRGYREYERWLNRLLRPEEIAREAYVECPVAHPTWMARTAILRQLGYRDCPWPEDYDLLLRMLAAGYRVATLPERLHLWRVHAGQTRLRHPRYSHAAMVRAKAHFLARGPLREQDRYVLWGYGATGRALRRALVAEGKHAAAIVEVHPRRLAAHHHRPPFLAPPALKQWAHLPLLISVSGAEAREEIRTFLADFPYREGENCLFTA